MNNKIETIINQQQSFFNQHQTQDIGFRIDTLKRLYATIKKYEPELLQALNADLGKNEFEAFTNEVGMALREISFHIRNVKKWARPKRVSTPIYALPSKSYITQKPFGRILIIGPFNFPFMLTIIPLIGAVSAGNVVLVKPSENTPHTSRLIEKVIAESFNRQHVAVIQGGVETSSILLEKRWDKIFFTGSTRVGKIVMEAAAKHLTPVDLELGGKNPVVVDKDANLKIAVKRIIWGKYLNAGQSCVAPDYLFVHESIKEEFLRLTQQTIKAFYSEAPQKNGDFGRIVDAKTVRRIAGLLNNEKIAAGGDSDVENRFISPTIVRDVQPGSPLMKDEIFGPVLPVLSFSHLDEVVDYINKNARPLALYYFSENKKSQCEFLKKTSSGDAGINEVVMHFTNFALPFGGVGYSGMGSYHGKHSFDTFSHRRSVVKNTTLFDIPLRYPPVKKWVLKFMRLLFR